MLETLDSIAIRHGTDKASAHAVKGHSYATHYERAFGWVRFLNLKVLEIGVGGGESIRMWLEWFPNARVFGIDNNQGTNPWNTVGDKPDPRYHFVYGDQSDRTFWKCFVADYGTGWDILIDDGGHFNDQIVTTWQEMFQHIAPGGFYCVEDLGAGFTTGSVFLKPDWPTHRAFCMSVQELALRSDLVDYLDVSRELLIIKKK